MSADAINPSFTTRESTQGRRAVSVIWVFDALTLAVLALICF